MNSNPRKTQLALFASNSVLNTLVFIIRSFNSIRSAINSCISTVKSIRRKPTAISQTEQKSETSALERQSKNYILFSIVRYYNKRLARTKLTNSNRYLPFYSADVLIRGGNIFKPATFLVSNGGNAMQQRANFLKTLFKAKKSFSQAMQETFSNMINTWHNDKTISTQIDVRLTVVSLDVFFKIDINWLKGHTDFLEKFMQCAKQFEQQWQSGWTKNGWRGQWPSQLYAKFRYYDALLRKQQKKDQTSEFDKYFMQEYGYKPNVGFIILVLSNFSRALKTLIRELNKDYVAQLVKAESTEQQLLMVKQLIKQVLRNSFRSSSLLRTKGTAVHIYPQGEINVSKTIPDNLKTDAFGLAPRRCLGAETLVKPAMKTLALIAVQKHLFFQPNNPNAILEDHLNASQNSSRISQPVDIYGEWAPLQQ